MNRNEMVKPQEQSGLHWGGQMKIFLLWSNE